MKLKRGGFSLLEILLTLIILSAGVIGLSRAFSTGIFASTDVEYTELALGIAQAKLENIYGTAGGVSDEAMHSVDSEDFVGEIYQNRNFQIGVATDENDPEQVDVTVYWDVKGSQASITLTTLMADYY